MFDSQPRTICNLIVDQTANNPAAYATAYDPGWTASDLAHGGRRRPQGWRADRHQPGLDGVFGTADDTEVFFIPNVTPDAGLSAPFNAWMTFFGQFFDHGLDLVTKGGNGTIFIPLQPDDPLVRSGRQPDQLHGADAGHQSLPGSGRHPRHRRRHPRAREHHLAVRRPEPDLHLASLAPGVPARLRARRGRRIRVATGKLITNRDLGADGKFGTADDVEIGGMATWAVVKAQARDMLGINLTDADVVNVPLLATDAYGNFIKGPNGFPQVVIEAVPTASPAPPTTSWSRAIRRLAARDQL